MSIAAKYSSTEFLKTSPDFRIGCIIADGMWYSMQKWRKLARVQQSDIDTWMTHNGSMLIQATSGAQSYRMGLDALTQWHHDHGFEVGDQIVDFLFPARVWDKKTETEGFLNAPLREVGTVSFRASPHVAQKIKSALRGTARVCEESPRKYRAYCLDANHIKPIILDILDKFPESEGASKVTGHNRSRRRELCDFSENFKSNLLFFYIGFAKSLVKKHMDTISIFLPDPIDRESQIIMWVIEAIRKFDESASVPFSGYLNSVLGKWPYDVPAKTLGRELCDFQRNRSKAISDLKKQGEEYISTAQLAEKMGLDKKIFDSYEAKHKTWLSTKNATSLIWEENGEEKSSSLSLLNGGHDTTCDIGLANQLSMAIIQTALDTGDFDNAFLIIDQMDDNNIDDGIINNLSPQFVSTLGKHMDIGANNA